MPVDVLIVGAGPTGLLLAAQLARQGINPRLIDKNPQPSDKSKALAVFARTLEIFEELGIVEEAIARGRKLHEFNFYADGRRIAHIKVAGINSFFEFVLCLPQYETECLLEQRVESLGVKVERSVTFTALEQDTQGVTATLCHADGQEEHCRTTWLIGCDGAGSTVRRQMGLNDEGTDLASSFVLVDARVDWPLSPNGPHVIYSSNGVLAAIPLPHEGYWRIINNLSPGTDPPINPDLNLFQQLADERSHLEIFLSDPQWTSSFSIRQRMAETSQLGRVLLAGDALSSHSPVGGQGMNTGLQDAYNLAWKLALVIQNKGRAELLDSYSAEREPISKSLLTATAWATQIVTLRNPVFKQIRQYSLSFLTGFDRVQHRIATTLSELNVNYRHSPIVQEDCTFPLAANRQGESLPGQPNVMDWFDFRKGPKAGDRAPDVIVQTGEGAKRLFRVFSEPKHNLLLFEGKSTNKANYDRLTPLAWEIEEKFGDRITVHLVLLTEPEESNWHGSLLLDSQAECHQCYSAGGECLYLIRPDGYIGYRSQPVDADKLRAYLRKILV